MKEISLHKKKALGMKLGNLKVRLQFKRSVKYSFIVICPSTTRTGSIRYIFDPIYDISI